MWTAQVDERKLLKDQISLQSVLQYKNVTWTDSQRYHHGVKKEKPYAKLKPISNECNKYSRQRVILKNHIHLLKPQNLTSHLTKINLNPLDKTLKTKTLNVINERILLKENRQTIITRQNDIELKLKLKVKILFVPKIVIAV